MLANLVLFDLPETPALLEQRIGRLDRIGQSQTVKIYVPFLEDTDHASLANWYDKGLDAFETPIEGGSKLLALFEGEMKKVEPSDKSGWEKIIKSTQEAKRELDEQLEKGRDRLLEMSSFNAEASKKIVSAIEEIDDETELEGIMIDLFDQIWNCRWKSLVSIATT